MREERERVTLNNFISRILLGLLFWSLEKACLKSQRKYCKQVHESKQKILFIKSVEADFA